ncbi:MAG: hypothetical protein ABIR94_22450 [Rubrivivax sp.]
MNKKTSWVSALLVLAVALLGACSEKPQGVGLPKSATPAWQGAQGPFVASGWKVGDKASWQEQLRNRAKGQNEYLRIAGQ